MGNTPTIILVLALMADFVQNAQVFGFVIKKRTTPFFLQNLPDTFAEALCGIFYIVSGLYQIGLVNVRCFISTQAAIRSEYQL